MIKYSTLCNELNDLFYRVRIDPTVASIDEVGELTLAVFPRRNSDQEHERPAKSSVSIVLTAGLHVSPYLTHLPWGMIDDDGQLVGFGRTNGRGIVLASIPDGTYRMRYVAEPESELDREILLAIDDADSRAMLAQWEVLATGTISQWLSDIASGSETVTSYGFSDDEIPGETIQEGKTFAFSRDGNWLCVDIPETDAKNYSDDPFPGGVLLIEYSAADGRAVATGLMPITLNSQKHYVGRIRVDRFTDTDHPPLSSFAKIEEDLSELVQRVDLEMVDEVLNSDELMFNPELRERIENLKQLIEGKE